MWRASTVHSVSLHQTCYKVSWVTLLIMQRLVSSFWTLSLMSLVSTLSFPSASAGWRITAGGQRRDAAGGNQTQPSMTSVRTTSRHMKNQSPRHPLCDLQTPFNKTSCDMKAHFHIHPLLLRLLLSHTLTLGGIRHPSGTCLSVWAELGKLD